MDYKHIVMCGGTYQKWELWQVIKRTPLNKVDYTNYVRINDYTCDIDESKDIKLFERFV